MTTEEQPGDELQGLESMDHTAKAQEVPRQSGAASLYLGSHRSPVFPHLARVAHSVLAVAKELGAGVKTYNY